MTNLSDFKAKKLKDLKPGKYWKLWSKKERKRDPEGWKKHTKERVKYGYSEVDWWSFDSYIAGVIAHACEKFAAESHGHPGNMTAEDWTALCLDISRPLALWASADRWELSWDDSLKLYTQVQEALHMFADNFGSFWD